MGCGRHSKEPPAQTPRNTLKVLCLGVGGCGKTTFIKQMRILHNPHPWHVVEIENFVKVIRGNYINGMQDVLDISKKLGLALAPENEERSKQVISMRARTADLTPEQLELLKALWTDPAIQEVVKNHNEKMTITHLQYFWENFDRITQAEYVPSDEDILRARMRTAGANSSSVFIDKNYFEFFDVGGQKPERSKWEQVLSEHKFAAIIYFVASDEFDVDDEEKEFERTKMEISRFIFSEIVNSDIIQVGVPVILFLNREDLFTERLKDPAGIKAFRETFPEYMGGDSKEEGLGYVKEFFLAVVKENTKNPIKVHNTCALDRESMVVVWHTVREFLLRQALHDIGLTI